MTPHAPLRIGLLVGNPFRELPNQILTALRLCQDGCTSLLIPAYLMNDEIWTLAPDFVLLEHLRRGKIGLLRRMASAGIRAGVLDTEGGVFTDLDAYLRKTIPQTDVLKTVAEFYSWGPLVARRLVEAGRLSDAQVTVTGTPRMDFYADPWRRAALRLTPLPDELRRPFVLINSNFNMANPWSGDLDWIIREYVGDGYDRATALRWLDIQRRGMQEFIVLAQRLAARLPEVDFVYRPHPFETPEPYREPFRGLPNLRLIKQGAVHGWVSRACAVIQRGSSTAIDAALAAVPALSPAWIPCHLHLPSVEALSVPCHSEQELVDQIQAAVAGHPRTPPGLPSVLDGIVSDWFFAVDGRSHDRVAAAILRSCDGPSSVSLPECLRILDRVFGPKVSWRRRARAFVRRALHLPIHWSFRYMREQPPLGWDPSQACFGAEEVRSIAAVLEPAARELYGPGWRAVRVRAAAEQGEYHFGYAHGRSIALTAAQTTP